MLSKKLYRILEKDLRARGYLYDRVKEVSEQEHGARHVVDVERLSRRLTPN